MGDVTGFIVGFERFREKYFAGGNSLYARLRHAQSPKALVIACCDSRVDPAILLDVSPGELFVVRNVANLVPPHAGDRGTHGVSAALEFAVCSLHVEDIVVLGHSQCGGIGALLSGAAGEYITRWMDIVREAAMAMPHSSDTSPHAVARACEHHSILLSLRNLMTFPFVKERVESGILELHGWYFDLAGGTLEAYDDQAGEFRVLTDASTE